MIYTVVGEDFAHWVDNRMKERTKRLAEDRNLNITMDPAVYKIFKESTSISGTCT